MPTDLLSPHDLARMVLPQQHPLTRSWMDDAARLELLAEEHAFDLQLASDLDLAGQRAAFLDVGQPPEAFLNRWAEVAPGLSAMLSIRFEGLDRAKPFVDALTSRAWTAQDLPALVGTAREVYGPFRPRYLRLWSAEPDGRSAETGPDRRMLAAPMGELRSGTVPPELILTPTLDLGRYAAAQTAYDAVNAQHPAHIGQASIQPAEDLQENIEAGTLFDVLLDGQWVGYAGAKADTELGLPTYTVQELLLIPQARGRGYGPALTTLLARRLPDVGRLLFGHIHARNRGAREAALRAGRHDIGGWVQVPLAEPGRS